MKCDKEILWSTWVDEECCENIYDDCNNKCSDDYDCPYRNGCEIDYDYTNEYINENLNEKFKENEYEYFVVGDSCNWYGGFKELEPNMNGFSKLYSSVKDILYALSDGIGMHDFRIYKGKFDTVWIELSHHDGSQLYQLCRLNKQGRKYYDKGYDFDYSKHKITSVLKDFSYYNWG